MTTWAEVDDYFSQLIPEDDALVAAHASSSETTLPGADVTPHQGALLAMLARTLGARRVLEFGTLAGYSTIWLARAVGPDGHVDTLEIDPGNAAVARRNFDAAGVTAQVQLHLGPAAATAEWLIDTGTEPYDLVFIDADKPNNPHYLAAARQLTRPGALIIVDNVVRAGAVADPDDDTPAVLGVRRLVDDIVAAGLDATAIQTVGAKGWDGFAIIRV
ncbi:O-methyltransferase [Protaetiibacter mangrovi]|uniref:O-methyltransferase n=1 Tax=Protaetiibacter mangrovi TaxID=2970926 RepID=A0ABT1ZIJ0_9MICO|nr:O-methyltransferase [Protaetiibacter mangrovi]MCS0500511.1 O-methyltransferase [Protaetiibacter mangrovi]TPX02987.1 O-methyltransferase [Schumannella luteola]